MHLIALISPVLELIHTYIDWISISSASAGCGDVITPPASEGASQRLLGRRPTEACVLEDYLLGQGADCSLPRHSVQLYVHHKEAQSVN